jgi:glycosyltransferase involved in cell wall biosynthesis
MTCRLLYLVGQLGPGGLERQLCYLLQAIDRKRYRPAVAVWNFHENDVYVPRLRALGIPVYELPVLGSPAEKLRAWRSLVRRIEPEVVHSYCFYLNFAAHYGAYGTGAFALGSVRSDYILDKQINPWWVTALSGRWPRHQICNSVVAAENLRCSKGPFVPQRLSVVRNGIDLQQFCAPSLRPSARVCLLGVGSLLPVKRWDRLLRVAQALKQDGLDFIVRIAGGGPSHQFLGRLAHQLTITDRVEFLGHADDVSRLLRDATFLVHTSDNEGCPNVVMEAMACRRAVVATDAGDTRHLVDDGKTGFVVCRGDDATLVERVATLISDRLLCLRMGEAGRTKAEREFGLCRLAAETLAAYRDAGWRDS